MKYILAHDLGTSGNKATLFSAEGRLVTSEVFSYGCHYFNGIWAEQEPEDWWQAICVTSKNLISKAGIDAGDVAVVSFSGQMMGCLCVDRAGTPLRPSIIWADQRAQPQASQIAEHISMYDFYHISGHRNSPSYGLQKLMWVRDNEPEIYAKTYKTLNAKDFIVLRLTGNFYTEPSDATSNGCIDLNTLQWSEKLVNLSGIDGDKLPTIVPSTTVAGEVTRRAAEQTGLKAGTPVVMGGGDGLCSNVGAGSVSVGKTFSYVGSSAWVATTSDKPLFDEEMRTFTWAHIVPGLYSPTGTMQSAGGAYNWLKQQVCKFETAEAQRLGVSPYDLINAEVAGSPVGSNGVFFLPYLLGERAPRWNSDATAAWLGLKMENQRGDMLRAVLEGVTMNLNVILDILRKSLPIDELLVIGGGAKGPVWCQMMADIYNAKITVPVLLEEATSMGAAMAGGVGIGIFKDFTEIDKMIEINHTVTPDPAAVKAYGPVKEAFEVCYEAMKPLYSYLAGH
ncbi:Carbohydrate kinase, FGGY family protein [uncultured Eubacteriales bacterium]|uniref:Carbohydrate kinase, FGGY family protein n=1 Tax=uncultured Eubacteriales bacterium TaxID=172733 RepID=A0A212KEC0_9FIRM|nr:Carbohydrate kinase, FGGY family protein [uncultured Eubacteriales bacterium]